MPIRRVLRENSRGLDACGFRSLRTSPKCPAAATSGPPCRAPSRPRILMQRTLNTRLLAGLLLLVVSLGAGIAALHHFQVKRSSGSLLGEADRAEARGDLGQAEEALS